MAFVSRLLRWWKPEAESVVEEELSVDNCGLSKEQIRLARFTLGALGLESPSRALSLEDLVFLCYSVGMNPPEYVIEAKLRSLGRSSQTHHSFEHFLHLWRALLENQDEEEVILERAFNFFDKDGNGEISTTEFKSTMTELGNLLSEAEMDEFLRLMDTNHDGVVDYGEFIRLLRSQRPVYMDLANRTSEDYELAQPAKATTACEEIQSYRETIETRPQSSEEIEEAAVDIGEDEKETSATR